MPLHRLRHLPDVGGVDRLRRDVAAAERFDRPRAPPSSTTSGISARWRWRSSHVGVKPPTEMIFQAA
jgi:hypothetical protein